MDPQDFNPDDFNPDDFKAKKAFEPDVPKEKPELPKLKDIKADDILGTAEFLEEDEIRRIASETSRGCIRRLFESEALRLEADWVQRNVSFDDCNTEEDFMDAQAKFDEAAQKLKDRDALLRKVRSDTADLVWLTAEERMPDGSEIEEPYDGERVLFDPQFGVTSEEALSRLETSLDEIVEEGIGMVPIGELNRCEETGDFSEIAIWAPAALEEMIEALVEALSEAIKEYSESLKNARAEIAEAMGGEAGDEEGTGKVDPETLAELFRTDKVRKPGSADAGTAKAKGGLFDGLNVMRN